MQDIAAMTEQADVCLVSMPYPPLNQPSMALGLLHASLLEAGIGVAELHPSIWFAETIGLDAYVFISDTKQEFLIGEWTFSGAAFRDDAPVDPEFLPRVLAAPVSQALLNKSRFRDDPHRTLLRVRAAAPAFVDRVARRVLEGRPRIVGCTSTFMQHVPSIALLRRIKELAPEVATMIGGANCEGEMGVATKRCFPWIDYVVSGEADLLFPELCRRIIREDAPGRAADLPYGVIASQERLLSGADPAPRASVEAMDAAPTPNFDAYFAGLEASSLAPFVVPGLAMETSRGCWWGKKHHCTFCGLNGGNMSFRSKQPERVIRELDHLSGRHGINRFNIVDNILDLRYLDTVMPELARTASYKLFFETKSNLRRDQVEKIAAAGVRRLQPGLESMHDGVLKLIDKGTSALINLRLLRWARELGVFITWNFLWDVPGEQDVWYAEMAEWLPRVTHLQPAGIDRIQFHRFSPYHVRPASFGLELAPFPTYAAVYPLGEDDLRDIAYYHHDARRRSARDSIAERPGLKQVLREIARWNRAWASPAEQRPALVLREATADGTVIDDTRPASATRTHCLNRIRARVLAACDEITSEAATIRALSADHSAEEVRQAISELDRAWLVLRQGDKFMSLATRTMARIPEGQDDFPGGFVDLDAWHQAEHSGRIGKSKSLSVAEVGMQS